MTELHKSWAFCQVVSFRVSSLYVSIYFIVCLEPVLIKNLKYIPETKSDFWQLVWFEDKLCVAGFKRQRKLYRNTHSNYGGVGLHIFCKQVGSHTVWNYSLSSTICRWSAYITSLVFICRTITSTNPLFQWILKDISGVWISNHFPALNLNDWGAKWRDCDSLRS